MLATFNRHHTQTACNNNTSTMTGRIVIIAAAYDVVMIHNYIVVGVDLDAVGAENRSRSHLYFRRRVGI